MNFKITKTIQKQNPALKGLIFWSFLVLAFVAANSSFASNPKEVEFKVEKIGEVTHWTPKSVNVKKGETLKIKAVYDLTGGFDFHGFAIPKLKIAKKVLRNKPEVFEVTIPAEASGELDITCQFHAPHKGAKLLVQ